MYLLQPLVLNHSYIVLAPVDVNESVWRKRLLRAARAIAFAFSVNFNEYFFDLSLRKACNSTAWVQLEVPDKIPFFYQLLKFIFLVGSARLKKFKALVLRPQLLAPELLLLVIDLPKTVFNLRHNLTKLRKIKFALLDLLNFIMTQYHNIVLLRFCLAEASRLLLYHIYYLNLLWKYTKRLLSLLGLNLSFSVTLATPTKLRLSRCHLETAFKTKKLMCQLSSKLS